MTYTKLQTRYDNMSDENESTVTSEIEQMISENIYDVVTMDNGSVQVSTDLNDYNVSPEFAYLVEELVG